MISQTIILRSALQLAKNATLKGAHSTFTTSSVCPSKVCNRFYVFLRSQKPIVLSYEPDKKIFSWKGLKSKEYISPIWAENERTGFGSRISQRLITLSSPQEPNQDSLNRCHETSSTLPLCDLKLCNGCTCLFISVWASISHKQISSSFEPDSKYPSLLLLHDKP